MSARFSHRHNPGRSSVTVSVRPGDGRISESFECTEGEGRRLAWALLADLAPDEVDADDQLMEAAAVVYPIKCKCGAGVPRLSPDGKAYAVLDALSSGPATAADLGTVIDRSTSIASSFVSELMRKGLAMRSLNQRIGEPTVYLITQLGRAALANPGDRAA